MKVANVPRRLGGATPTIGLLVDWLEDDYQNAVMRGAVDAARERGYNLVCFSGGVLDSPLRNGLERNQVFELATATSVSGLLLMGGTMGNASGPLRLGEYCKRYAGIPACCIGIRLADMPSVLVDNAAGMREGLLHLLNTHDRRRIFFIRGPSVNEEAEKRFAIYNEVLAESGLERTPELWFEGDFQPQSGYQAIQAALQSGVKFDAVVAANDSMAMGALRALTEHNIDVPRDVALLGFDDIEEARFLDPPLSTVRQPLYDQGKHAVRVLVQFIQSGSAPLDVTLRTQLVPRRSCGCLGGESTSQGLAGPSTSLSFEAQLIQRRSVLLADLVRCSQASFGGIKSGWEARLFSAFLDDLNDSRPGAFIETYQDALQQVFHTDNPIEAWQDVLSALRRHALAALGSDITRYRHAEDLFQQARLLTSNVVERVQARKRLDAEKLVRSMARAGAALIATFDEDALFEACREHIPALGVGSVYIVRTLADSSEQVQLVFAHDEGRDSPIAVPRTFNKEQLLPKEALPGREPYALIVEPLFFRHHTIGYAVFGFGPKSGTLYESLRDQISAALHGARLNVPA